MSGWPTARLVVAAPDPVTEARIRYAFCAYAALYGLDVHDGPTADVSIGYGDSREATDVTLATSYRPRPASVPAPAPTWVDGMPCFHPGPGGEPDVLGEVFEWLSAAHEGACTALDAVGRVPPEHTLAGTHGIDRKVPWVNRWLARLHAAVRGALPRLPAAPRSPFGAGATFVASHDMDHLSANRVRNSVRLAKNVGIAVAGRRDVRTGMQILGSAAHRAVRRRPTTVGVDDLLTGEAARGVRATYTVVAESTHRRDPGYHLDDDIVHDTLRRVTDHGHEVAVHGSYSSLTEPGRLAHEYRLLASAGFPPAGGRQHWLRHRGGELFDALVQAGAQWDSTSGHSDVVGYRNGAAFPFLPYDVERERAHPVVEIPLVVMERALCSEASDPQAWPAIASDVLHAAGAHGWGGTAVLWHDYAFTGTALPHRLADAYWTLLDAGDRWVTAAEVASAAQKRWTAAGVGLVAGRPEQPTAGREVG